MIMRRLGHYLSHALSLGGLFIVIYGCYGIFTRAVFKFQNLWFTDFILMVLVSILWLFSIHVVVDRRETSMEAVVDMLHGRKKGIYKAILDIISGVCCLFLGLSGLALLSSLVELNLNISTVLPIPQWVPVLCFIISMMGCSVAFLIRALSELRLTNGN